MPQAVSGDGTVGTVATAVAAAEPAEPAEPPTEPPTHVDATAVDATEVIAAVGGEALLAAAAELEPPSPQPGDKRLLVDSDGEGDDGGGKRAAGPWPRRLCEDCQKLEPCFGPPEAVATTVEAAPAEGGPPAPGPPTAVATAEATEATAEATAVGAPPVEGPPSGTENAAKDRRQWCTSCARSHPGAVRPPRTKPYSQARLQKRTALLDELAAAGGPPLADADALEAALDEGDTVILHCHFYSLLGFSMCNKMGCGKVTTPFSPRRRRCPSSGS
jgi:hypothetical protein